MESNNIRLVGKLTDEIKFNHETYNEKFYDTKIEVKRLSGDFDEIGVIVSERLIIGKKIEKGSVVEINGQLRSYNLYSETEKRRRLLLNVFVKDIREVSEFEFEDDEKLETTNEVELIGYICKKPIFRTTPFGREIADLLLAVNRTYGKSDYLPCIAWGRNARFSENLNIGQVVRIVGRMQSRQYTKDFGDGNIETRTAYEVSVGRLELPKDDINELINDENTIEESEKTEEEKEVKNNV